jgi:hypothetical protein
MEWTKPKETYFVVYVDKRNVDECRGALQATSIDHVHFKQVVGLGVVVQRGSEGNTNNARVSVDYELVLVSLLNSVEYSIERRRAVLVVPNHLKCPFKAF